MGKIVLNTSNTTEKQKLFLSCRKKAIDNIKKDCRLFGFSNQNLEELERDFL